MILISQKILFWPVLTLILNVCLHMYSIYSEGIFASAFTFYDVVLWDFHDLPRPQQMYSVSVLMLSLQCHMSALYGSETKG